MKKNLFVRVDTSPEIGTGHILRCVGLADELRNTFDKIIFLSRKTTRSIIEIILKNGFEVSTIDTPIKKSLKNNSKLNNELETIGNLLIPYKENLNFLLIDHYDISSNYESSLRKIFKKIFVIDDLANRQHDCDLLIDQNYYKDLTNRYLKLVSKNTITLLGPKYVILRSEFRNSKKINYKKNTFPKRILISFGGSDPTNECEKVLNAIFSLKNKQFVITAVTGIHNKNFKQLKKQFGGNDNTKILNHTNNFNELLLNSDLCFGAGGTTTWERLYLGLPSIVTIISSDQKESIEFLSDMGHVINLGLAKDVTTETYAKTIKKIDPKILYNLSLKNKKLIDGKGCARIKKQIIKLINDIHE